MNTQPASFSASLVKVTPEMAREFLRKNLINRSLRRRWIESLARQILAGEWVPTTDAIGFRSDGMLVNGQHRLLAIIQANKPVLALLAYGVPDGAYMVTDRGHGRSYSDVLNKPAALVADGNMLSHFLQDPAHPGGTRVSEAYIAGVLEWWEPAYFALLSATDSKFGKGFSSAAIRVGFAARWASEPDAIGRSYVLNQYKALNSSDAPQMSAAGGSLWKRILREKWGGGPYERRILGACNSYYSINPRLYDRAPLVRDMAAVRLELAAVVKALPAAYSAWVANGRKGHPYQIKQPTTLALPAPPKPSDPVLVAQTRRRKVWTTNGYDAADTLPW